VRSPSDPAEELDTDRQRLRQRARDAVGVGGDGAEDPQPLRSVLRMSGAGWYPLLGLGVLAVVGQFLSYALFVLAPEISRALGVDRPVLAGLQALKLLAVTSGGLLMAANSQRLSRASMSVASGLAWSVVLVAAGLVANVWGLAFVLVAEGIANGSIRSLHPPLLVDSYPPVARVRTLSAYRALEAAGNVVVPLFVGLLAGALGFTWRGVLIVCGCASLLVALTTLRLRDPGFGRWDEDRVRTVVRREEGEDDSRLADKDVELGFFEIVQRLLLVPTVRRMLTGYAVLGVMLTPLLTYLFFYLKQRWGLGPGQRSLFFAALPLFSFVTLRVFGPRAERLFRDDPARLAGMAAALLAGAMVLLAASMAAPNLLVMILLFGGAIGLFDAVLPALNVMLLSIVRPQMRAHASALSGIALAGVGGFAGLFLMSGFDRRFGTGAAIAFLALPGLAAALVVRGARSTINADLDAMVDAIVEEEELDAMRRRQVTLPLLACRHVDFSYGSVQVLFDVDFTIQGGEMVALLGTNGAGKSTLLRVISGLGLPSRGSIRYRGADITYLDAERRGRLGITQVPGGKAVFGELTVVENLRVHAYDLGRDRRAVEQALETAFDAFPALAARRDASASTLSGGEQQMLALTKALILKPRLLLIDELSLGLAPKIVGELLEMVRRINADGTAVVLVEQSVNVALSLVEHAYFMEKGEIRFDGRASDLLERPDLLRSVFLEGAARGLA
jgi:ABC-type branched-subunit amino acid transport system ATPase component/sugar phosphate permease